jgi:hypothetical protein
MTKTGIITILREFFCFRPDKPISGYPDRGIDNIVYLLLYHKDLNVSMVWGTLSLPPLGLL